MDGVHDLGGVQGFGPVDAPVSEPVFGEEWERRAFRANMATLGALGVGGARWRHAIERMDPVHYLDSSYYEHWLTASATLIVEDGVASKDELERHAGGAFPLSRADRGMATAGEPARTQARFAVGDEVRVREWHPLGHTRAPRYVQGKRGVVTRVDRPANFPDLEAHAGGTVLDPTYSVRFTARELWGDGGGEGVTVNVDVWERYLEASS